MGPIDPQVHWFLFTIAFLGSAAAYTAVSRMFAPPPDQDDSDLSKLAKKEVGTSSAFSGLNPNGGMIDIGNYTDWTNYCLGSEFKWNRWGYFCERLRSRFPSNEHEKGLAGVQGRQ